MSVIVCRGLQLRVRIMVFSRAVTKTNSTLRHTQPPCVTFIKNSFLPLVDYNKENIRTQYSECILLQEPASFLRLRKCKPLATSVFCWTDKLQRKHLTLRREGKKTYRLAERYVWCFVDFAWSHDSIWISKAFLDWDQKQTNQKKKISTLEISLLKYLQSACFHIHAATCSPLRVLNELRENGIASNLLLFPVWRLEHSQRWFCCLWKDDNDVKLQMKNVW